MSEDGHDLVQRIHRETVERIRSQPLQPIPERPELKYTELPEAEPDSPVAEEWHIFRREVERLLSEGHKDKVALIKEGQPITIWDTLHDAAQAGWLLYGPGPCLVQQILPYLRPLSTPRSRLCRE
jgi:hypothetical protein